MGGRDHGPAAGVGVVFFVEHQAQVGVTARGQLVGGTRDAFAIVAAHQLDNGASGQADRHLFELQGHVVVRLGRVQAERCLFCLGQIHPGFTGLFDRADAFSHVGIGQGAAHQIGLARNRVGLNADQGLVVHARFHAGLVTHQHLVRAVEDCIALRN